MNYYQPTFNEPNPIIIMLSCIIMPFVIAYFFVSMTDDSTLSSGGIEYRVDRIENLAASGTDYESEHLNKKFTIGSGEMATVKIDSDRNITIINDGGNVEVEINNSEDQPNNNSEISASKED